MILLTICNMQIRIYLREWEHNNFDSIPLAAWLERKHEWAITAILPEENRPVRLYPVGSGQSSAALKSTPERNLRFSDPCEYTSSQCCVDPLRPPVLWGILFAHVVDFGEVQ
jgi:hypothetical protein